MTSTRSTADPTAAPDWNPQQYGRFAAERRQPFDDLVGLAAPAPGGRAVDLGCGPGELTIDLHRALGLAQTRGIDNSEAMLAAARQKLGDVADEGVSFEHGDLASFTDRDLDVIAASASLHWVPDHPTVLGRWAASLAPGGQLLVQVPANPDHPSHLLITEVASSGAFADCLPDGPPPDPVLDNVLKPDQYATILDDLGLVDIHVRLQVYLHHLESTASVVEWTKGTSLTRLRPSFTDERWADFLDVYRRRLVEVLGDRSPYAYPFKRILMRARRPGRSTTA